MKPNSARPKGVHTLSDQKGTNIVKPKGDKYCQPKRTKLCQIKRIQIMLDQIGPYSARLKRSKLCQMIIFFCTHETCAENYYVNLPHFEQKYFLQCSSGHVYRFCMRSVNIVSASSLISTNCCYSVLSGHIFWKCHEGTR